MKCLVSLSFSLFYVTWLLVDGEMASCREEDLTSKLDGPVWIHVPAGWMGFVWEHFNPEGLSVSFWVCFVDFVNLHYMIRACRYY